MSNISVIIPTYQHATVLPRCLESVLRQTKRPYEILVVDDGSTDATREAVQPFLETGVRYIPLEHGGAPRARNRGFQESSGDLVLFLDADIELQDTMLERLSHALDEHPSASYAYSSFQFGWKRFRGRPFSGSALKRMNYIHTSALIRREHFPGFDESLKRFQDWDLWLTMLEQGYYGVWVPEQLFVAGIDKKRGGYSSWRPSVYYRVPWNLFGKPPEAFLKYQQAREHILRKHGLWT